MPAEDRHIRNPLLIVFLNWCRQPTPPDPWGEEFDDLVNEPGAIPICHRCFESNEPGRWFCHQCGTAIGPYNNLMPYIYVFSIGEVLLSGVGRRSIYNFLTFARYILFPIFQYGPLAVVYLLRVFWNLGRVRKQRKMENDLDEDHPNPEQ